ncbi:hypothetical protein ZWY2020_017423 [Hordeum vulgare]|nr:hypothetical protein ZWY2020_017423 [Hordeum vulgare]
MPTYSHVSGDGLTPGSASSIISGVVSGYHLLKIVGYSGTKEVPNGKRVNSCPFQVGGRTWHVRYYPNGSMPEHIDFISFFLKLDGTVAKGEAVNAKFKLSLLDQHGKPVSSYTRICNTIDFSVVKCQGFARFVERVELEESGHLKDDSFTIKVDVTIMNQCHAQKKPSVLVPPSDIHRHFGDLLLSKAGVDVEFVVGGETFSAHRLVLATRSPVFKAELFGPMKEGTTTGAIHIDDIKAQVFNALLIFIYTDALPAMDKHRNLPWLSICLLQQTARAILSPGTVCLSLYSLVAGIFDEAETVKAKFMFSLLDQHGKPVQSYTFTSDTREFSVHKGNGFGRFMRRVELEESGHLKDDSFTAKVDVTIMSEFHVLETPSILVPQSDLHRHLGVLLSSKADVDVEFQVGGETFLAHRLVLAVRSPVFKAELFGQMKEGITTETIRIDDMEAPVFNALLTFMYTDALPDMKQEEEYVMAQHLLVAADKYDLERLKLICEDKLCNRIDTSSVATILVLAEQHQYHELKVACLVFLSSPNNLDAAIESEGFELLTKNCPRVIKDLLKSQVSPSLLGKRKSRP